MLSIQCLVYNHEPYLRECLDGFVMQKTNFKFEAIVHDDCSTDGSTAIIKEYAEKYPNIIKPILETENQYSKGGGLLRKIMDSHMRGKYVALCEGDDYWTDPTKLQRQVDFLETHPDFTMCFHNAAVRAESGRDWYDCFGKLETREYKASEIIKYWKVPTCSIVVRKEVYLQRPNNPKYRMGDNVLVMTCLTYGKVWCIARKMGTYRLTPTSWLGTHIGKKNCYDFISHYKGMIEDFPLCRCEEMYKNMENQYFALMFLLLKEGNKNEFNHVKEDYFKYPGVNHYKSFKRYYYYNSFRLKIKKLLGHNASLKISRLKTILGLNKN